MANTTLRTATVSPEVLAVLEKARERIADPGHWATKANASTERGRSVSIHSPLACKWSLVGALCLEALTAVNSDDPYSDSWIKLYGPARQLVVAAAGADIALYGGFLSSDLVTHGVALAWLDGAIEKARDGRPDGR